MYDEDSAGLRRNREIPHYHGDSVRLIFVVGALLLIIAESTGANLPLSSGTVVIVAALLVVTAGISNPRQEWIHWVNAIIAAGGTLLFGSAVIERYQAGLSMATGSFIFPEILALLSLLALYLAVKTIRGLELGVE